MSDELPVWIAEGAQVAEYDTGGFDRGSVTFATVAKLTATQVVLDNGNRYRRRDLRSVKQRTSWSGYVELRAVDDQPVRDAVARRAIAGLSHRLEKCRKESITTSRALEILNDIEARIRKIRSALEGGTDEHR